MTFCECKSVDGGSGWCSHLHLDIAEHRYSVIDKHVKETRRYGSVHFGVVVLD